MSDNKVLVHLGDSELKIMKIIWQEGTLPAKQIAAKLTKKLGWNKNTTYTLLKRCIAKGAVQRNEPDFLCSALVTKEQVQKLETKALVDKLYDGAERMLFAALLGKKELTDEQLDRLKKMVDDW